MLRRDSLLAARTAAALVAVAAVVTTIATPALADPGADPLTQRSRVTPAAPGAVGKTHGPVSGVSARALATMTAQVELHRVAERIEAAAGSPPSSGLGGITVDGEHRALDLYWHGAVPDAVSREVKRARRTGVTINIIAAPYTLHQLRREVDRLAGLHMDGKVTAGDVISIAPKTDATGLLVGVSATAAGTPATRDSGRLAQLRAQVTSSVAIEFEDGAAQTADRWLDTPQFWGGALALRYTNPNADPDDFVSSCSTGFGVTGLNGAATYIMFANHCGEGQWRTGWYTFDDGSTYQETFGSTIPTRDALHDTQLIHTPRGAGSSVYIGDSWLGSGQPGRAVNAAAANRNGDAVCTSGSYSGLVCDIRVSATGVAIDVINYGPMRDMVRADHQLLRGAAGNGDSGGPVITTTGAGVTYARGTISAMSIDRFVDCFGVSGVPPNEQGRHCSWRIYYPQITDQLRLVGVRLNTL
jgi:hypothetical protein